MRLLNLGCGGTRPKSKEWINLDDLHCQISGVAREHLDREKNYVNFDVSSGPLPFPDGHFDGILASHFFEHFDAPEGLRLMRECLRVLTPGSPLVVSVPDASYFRQVFHQDKNENWPKLFGVTDPRNPIPTFFEAALWFDQHKAILTEDALWAYFERAGFKYIQRVKPGTVPACDKQAEIESHLNRLEFSLIMVGRKL